MNFEHKKFRFGISGCQGVYHFYTEKTLKTSKPQILLKDARTLEQAKNAVQGIIDKKVK